MAKIWGQNRSWGKEELDFFIKAYCDTQDTLSKIQLKLEVAGWLRTYASLRQKINDRKLVRKNPITRSEMALRSHREHKEKRQSADRGTKPAPDLPPTVSFAHMDVRLASRGVIFTMNPPPTLEKAQASFAP